MHFHLLSLLLVIAVSVSAQENQFLPRFGLQNSGEDILVYWSTAGGFTCEDLTVEFGIDTSAMERVYRYPGICGSESSEMSYQFVHRSVPENIDLFYRIDLGIFGKSRILKTRRRTIQAGFRIDPHPAGLNSVLYIENNGFHLVELTICTAEGRAIQTISGLGLRQIAFSDVNLPGNGLYIMDLTVNGVRHRELFVYASN